MKCPSFDRLLDYVDGHLDQNQGSLIADHLSGGCAQCSAEATWYQKVRSVAASDDSVEPPSWVTKRAVRIFESQRARPRIVERIGSAVATLIFDSLARPAVSGVRATETSGRQLLYQAGDYSIDVQIAPSAERTANLIAQVLRENQPRFESVSGLAVKLIREGECLIEARTTQMGELAITGLAFGVYDLQVDTPGGTITIQAVPIDALA